MARRDGDLRNVADLAARRALGRFDDAMERPARQGFEIGASQPFAMPTGAIELDVVEAGDELVVRKVEEGVAVIRHCVPATTSMVGLGHSAHAFLVGPLHFRVAAIPAGIRVVSAALKRVGAIGLAIRLTPFTLRTMPVTSVTIRSDRG